MTKIKTLVATSLVAFSFFSSSLTFSAPTTPTRPNPVRGVQPGKSITPSNTSACAAQPDGSVKCWGNSAPGTVGAGSSGPPPAPTRPATVPPAPKR